MKQSQTQLGHSNFWQGIAFGVCGKGREPIDWKLLTDLPIISRTQALEKLRWYASRWKIETFHKILKSGCKAEESRLRTAERLVNPTERSLASGSALINDSGFSREPGRFDPPSA